MIPPRSLSAQQQRKRTQNPPPPTNGVKNIVIGLFLIGIFIAVVFGGLHIFGRNPLPPPHTIFSTPPPLF
jgi:hypothetical protein